MLVWNQMLSYFSIVLSPLFSPGSEHAERLTLSGTSTIFSIFGLGSICDIGTTQMFLFTGIFNWIGSSASGFSIIGALTTNFSVTPVFRRDLYVIKTWGQAFGEDILHFCLRFVNPCSLYWLQQEPTLPAVFPSSPHQEGQPRDSFLAPLSPLHCHFCQRYLSELKLRI